MKKWKKEHKERRIKAVEEERISGIPVAYGIPREYLSAYGRIEETSTEETSSPEIPNFLKEEGIRILPQYVLDFGIDLNKVGKQAIEIGYNICRENDVCNICYEEKNLPFLIHCRNGEIKAICYLCGLRIKHENDLRLPYREKKPVLSQIKSKEDKRKYLQWLNEPDRTIESEVLGSNIPLSELNAVLERGVEKIKELDTAETLNLILSRTFWRPEIKSEGSTELEEDNTIHDTKQVRDEVMNK